MGQGPLSVSQTEPFIIFFKHGPWGFTHVRKPQTGSFLFEPFEFMCVISLKWPATHYQVLASADGLPAAQAR